MASQGAIKYRAFLCYSQHDRKVAEWLHRRLEGYRIPRELVGRETAAGKVPPSLRPVFRDRDELTAGHSLSQATEAVLLSSQFLVVICSPASAQSQYVNEQIRRFKAAGRGENILALIVDGEPGNPERECFAPALRFGPSPEGQVGTVPVEPIATDARPQGDGRDLATTKIIAALLGVGLNEVRGREAISQRRRTLLLGATAALMGTLAVMAALMAWIAKQQAMEAVRESERARLSFERQMSDRSTVEARRREMEQQVLRMRAEVEGARQREQDLRVRIEQLAQRHAMEEQQLKELERMRAARTQEEEAAIARRRIEAEQRLRMETETVAQRLELLERLKELEQQLSRASPSNYEQNLHRTIEALRRLSDPCVGNSFCTPVRVFFGTDREQQDTAERVDFGPDRANKLQLGRAIVTVPRAVKRKRGEVQRPTWWERVFQGVPAEGDPSKHFTIPKKGITLYVSPDDFLAAIREHMGEAGTFKDHAFVFVHGYRMTFDDALYRTAQIAFDLGGEGEAFGTAFLYSWPSGGDLKDYKYDFDSARLSTEYLETFVNLVIAKTGAKHLHLIAHSMGNWPMLAVLEKVAKAARPPPEIDQIILAAPDIDAAEFAKMAASIVGVAKGVTLYASSNDLAMKAARELHRGVPRAGDITDAGPVVLGGVDTIDVSFLSTDALATGHAEYAERRELLNDIALILRNGKGAPNARMPILEKMQVKDKVYWKYPN